MFALDLFNTDHERRIAEGAVDQLEQRRIDDLAMKMDDLVARAKKADTTEAKQALMKEFQKCKAERDSYYKVRNETMGYGGLTGEGQTTPTATGLRHHAKPGNYGGYEPEPELKGLNKTLTKNLEKGMGVEFKKGGVGNRVQPDMDEAGIPGNVPTEKIPGKEDLLKGKGRSYYESVEEGNPSKKVFKDKAGKPVGEIGIDPESSPGNGEWYVYHYGTGYSVVGFDSAAEAKRELMYVHKHPEAVEGHESTFNEAGIPGNVPVEKIPGKEDLLKGRGRSYYEAQIQKKNSKEVTEHGGGIGPKQHWQDLMQEQRLAVGDPIVVTGPNEFEGKTGEIDEFSPSGTFVVVNLYNHGKHSMHLSDIEYNEYADQEQDEEDDWYDDEDLNEFAPSPERDDDEVPDQILKLANRWWNATDDQPKITNVLRSLGWSIAQVESEDDAVQMQHDDGTTYFISADDFDPDVFEGYQDFNRVEPYAVCLAGKPVKKFDYYEQARRFHDNWKKKLYREGDRAKADTITLMPLGIDETVWFPTVNVPKFPKSTVDNTKWVVVYKIPATGETKIVAVAGNTEEEARKNLLTKNPAAKIVSVKQKGLVEDKKPKRTHTNDCNYKYGHDCDCAGTLTHANDCHYRYGHDCDCGLDQARKQGVSEEENQEYTVRVVDEEGSGYTVKVTATSEQGALHKAIVKVRNSGARPEHARIIRQDVEEAIVASGPSKPLDDRAVRKLVWDTMKINADTGDQAIQRALSVLAKKPQSRMVQDLQDKFQSLADRLSQGIAEAPTDYSKRRARERDVDAGKTVAKPRQSKQTDYQKRRAQDKKDMELGEDQDTSGVESAIIRRIMVAHTDLLKQFGPEKVMQAAEEVAYNVGDVDEIGTSDVSAYVAQVKQILGVPQELDEKWSQKYKSSINCANPKGFSQKAHCAGKKK